MTKHQLLTLLRDEIKELMGALSVAELVANEALVAQIQVALQELGQVMWK